MKPERINNYGDNRTFKISLSCEMRIKLVGVYIYNTTPGLTGIIRRAFPL